MARDLDKVEPPAIPEPQLQYSRVHVSLTYSVLRIFFRRLANAVNTLLSTNFGGTVLYFPRATAYSTSTQSAAVVDTGYAVEFDALSEEFGVSYSNDSEIRVGSSGVYRVDITLQVFHTSGGTETVTVWLAKGGVSQAYTATVTSVATNASTIVSWASHIALTSAEYFEVYWAASDTAVQLQSTAATSPHPGVASATVAVTFISNTGEA